MMNDKRIVLLIKVTILIAFLKVRSYAFKVLSR